jgi:hypothetical protein
MATSGSSKIMDKFFNLGNKVTYGSPVRKAYFDYILYWIVFSTFIFLSGNYIYSYIFKDASIGTLGWGIVVGIFSWFNYWALISFRMAYLNMKKFYDKPKEEKSKDKEEFKEMFAKS